MTIQKEIRILLVRRGNMSEAKLALRLKILDCTVAFADPVFKMNDTGEEI